MKIAIIGAHRVGKTTLAEELLEHLPGHVLHMEAYHEMEESGCVFSETPSIDDLTEQLISDFGVETIEANETAENRRDQILKKFANVPAPL